MATIEFRDIAELLNLSRTTRLDEKPQRAREGRWAVYPGVHSVHASEYPFSVLYFNSSSTLEDVRLAMREIATQKTVHIVYPPSLEPLLKNNSAMLGLLPRTSSMWNTKEYILSFIKDEIDTYLSRLRSLQPADYTNPRIETPAGFKIKTPNPVLSFLADPPTESTTGKLGIVLAEPGQGKTYMSNYLVSQLARGGHGVVPLMVDSSQWQGISLSDQKSLMKTIAHSFRHFGSPIGWLDGNEEKFLKATLKADIFRVVFDGFDEYILQNRGTVQALELLETLAELAQDTGTRIVITSRTSFWNTNLAQEEIQEFVQEAGALKFIILPFNRENAQNYFNNRTGDKLEQEKALQTYDILREASEDLVGRGFVLSLIADLAAHGGTSPHPGFDTSRAILWLVDALCQREIVRQKLPFTSAEQVDILTQFANEIATGAEPNTDLLQLIVSYVKPSLDSQSTIGIIEKLMSHPLLMKEGSQDKWTFKQEQVRILLLANLLVRIDSSKARRFAEKAILAPGAWQDLGEMAMELIRAGASTDSALERLTRLVRAISTPERAASDVVIHDARPGKLASIIALATVEKYSPAGTPRTDRAALLKKIAGGDGIVGLTFVGTIARYDFSGVEFRGCRFEKVTWANCSFDQESKFVGCEFLGGGAPIQCEGLGSAQMIECKRDPEAENILNSVRIREGKRKYSEQDLRSDMESVISKFVIKGGIGLKSIEARNLGRGTIAASRHREQIVEELVSSVLEEHTISGAGRGYHVRPGAEDAVKFFATNNVFTGALGEAARRLHKKLGITG